MTKLLQESLWSCEYGSFATFLEAPSVPIIHCEQIHSSIVIETKAQGFKTPPQADGIIDHSFEHILAIKTADCLPVLIIGKNGVAFIHAGWKGLRDKILLNPSIDTISPQIAYIGPHIKTHNYEVGSDFQEHFPNSKSLIKIDHKYFFSLEAQATEQLKKRWPHLKIQSSRLCTREHPQLNSYRQSRTHQRNWNVWIPRQLSDKLL